MSISAPAQSAVFLEGDDIQIDAQASDSDGNVVRVEFFEGANFLGEDTTAPFSFTWLSVPAGSYSLTALAFDNDGASSISLPVDITASDGSNVNLLLQDGTNGYLGTRDTYISGWSQNVNLGSNSTLLDKATKLNSLLRFDIFQSEGGPVPDGATILSATLSLYKLSAYDHVYRAHRLLREWDENEATWLNSRSLDSWSTPGADGLGSDILALPDDEAAVSWDPQWLLLDVTSSVQSFSSNALNNFGWRILAVSGNSNIKTFHSREASSDPTLKPKLEIAYTLDGNP